MQNFETNLKLTDSAVKRIQSLNQLENNHTKKLRVYVEGGGCSGYQYGFDLDEHLEDDDQIVVDNGGEIIIDSISLQYLQGSTINFVEDLLGMRFIVDNPNATSTCSCGTSFSMNN